MYDGDDKSASVLSAYYIISYNPETNMQVMFLFLTQCSSSKFLINSFRCFPTITNAWNGNSK
jgi:hypothetical protein